MDELENLPRKLGMDTSPSTKSYGEGLKDLRPSHFWKSVVHKK